MLNPVLSNFRMEFSDDFFPEALTAKYNKFLFYKNYPFKSLQGYLYETIQQINIPGINLQGNTVTGMNNIGSLDIKAALLAQAQTTVNRNYPGNAPINEIIDGINVTITFKNTMFNWMYCYEVLYGYYKRIRDVQQFKIYLLMMDSAEVPMIRFNFSDVFIGAMPGLEFAYNQSFSETKTFDVTFTFNMFDVEFIIPDFIVSELKV